MCKISNNLHQITKLSVLSVQEFWEPKQSDLDRLQITREIPIVSILLCKDELNPNENGYQAPSNVKMDNKKGYKRSRISQKRKNDQGKSNSFEKKSVKEEK
ncbi:ribonuclease P protein subunit p25-like protein [Caerostris extrusa]|uniref:Ribonuclease P protein subunit p25-like protein n=1 Tax=Caerostris extrusa TaxID=172846 RepID=A0AAV4SNL5_CAEEX|nr:ribonuclease P protein subunit p25-like protein [Caerostris extrusa]